MNKHWKDSLTYKTLITIRDILDDVYDVLPKQVSLYQVLHQYDKKTIYQTVKRLKDMDLIKEEEGEDGKIFSITEKGGLKLLGSENINPKENWDGYWRFVMFDVPADPKFRGKRDFFRSKIKQLGFKQYQKSVWISPSDFENEINHIKGLIMFKPYVKYILAKNISDEKKWLREFGLKKKLDQ